jgi:hypothetical protein
MDLGYSAYISAGLAQRYDYSWQMGFLSPNPFQPRSPFL